MRLESLVSAQNLRLAWRRINTARNLQYKRFFREHFLVYESALDDNLRDLRQRLLARAWKPSHAQRVYLPKPSGLQRPLSLLCLEDQIVLQAIANVFANKLRKQRNAVERKTVFSNILSAVNGSIFFTERWQTTYAKFQEKCIEHFNNGFRWTAHFDLAAYYDTISHDLLMKIAFPRSGNPETQEIVKEWFRTWSAADRSAMTGHGIPQGPLASDFLAEAFFLPIDAELQRKGVTYIRYVDDIRLFGKTENDVRQIAILLEQMCRHRGLIPQSEKCAIRKVETPEDAMGSLPSINPTAPGEATGSSMSAAGALRLLRSSLEGKPLRIKDKSRFRYVMYRAPTDSVFLAEVLRLFPRHPEHIDAFVAYFSNYGRRPAIARAALSYLERGVPYSYVRGELWHLLARLGDRPTLEHCLPLARQDARKRHGCVALSWGVMHFLRRCEEEGLSGLGKRLASEAPMSRALLSPKLSEKEFSPTGIVRKLLKGTLEEQLASAREIQRRGITLSALGLRQRDLPVPCQNALRALGVIRRRQRPNVDWIADRLTSLYGCKKVDIWRALLGAEYEHALQILIEANARHSSGAYSDWLALQDSFNDIMIRQLFDFLKVHCMPGHAATVTKKGDMMKYGILIKPLDPFDTHYPTEADLLRRLHDRRNKLPASHPYDEKGGSQNSWLKKPERDQLTTVTRDVLDRIAALVASHSH